MWFLIFRISPYPYIYQIMDVSTNHDFFSAKYRATAINAINLPDLLRSKLVTDNIPVYFKNREPPIISYQYTNTVASKLFNFSSTISNLDVTNYLSSPRSCQCQMSKYCDQPHGHIGLFQKISPPPPYGRHWIGYLKIPGFPRTTAFFAGFQSLLIQNIEEFQNFAKLWMVFPEFRLKLTKVYKIMDFQSQSLAFLTL